MKICAMYYIYNPPFLGGERVLDAQVQARPRGWTGGNPDIASRAIGRGAKGVLGTEEVPNRIILKSRW